MPRTSLAATTSPDRNGWSAQNGERCIPDAVALVTRNVECLCWRVVLTSDVSKSCWRVCIPAK